MEIHYRLKKSPEQFLEKELAQIKSIAIDVVRLDAEFSLDEIQRIKALLNNSALLLEDNVALAEAAGLNGVFFNSVSQALSYLANAPKASLNVGAKALNFADCKNLELQQADFIELNVAVKDNQSKMLGMELIENAIPKQDEYGWMIMSLNTPVIAAGLKNNGELSKVVKKSTMRGVLLTNSWDEDLSESLINSIKLMN